MNLGKLIEWCEKHANREWLRTMVRKDPIKQIPLENDVIVCLKMIEEIKVRAKLVEDHIKKAQIYQANISEYLEEIRKRGVWYPDPDKPNPFEKKEPETKTETPTEVPKEPEEPKLTPEQDELIIKRIAAINDGNKTLMAELKEELYQKGIIVKDTALGQEYRKREVL